MINLTRKHKSSQTLLFQKKEKITIKSNKRKDLDTGVGYVKEGINTPHTYDTPYEPFENLCFRLKRYVYKKIEVMIKEVDFYIFVRSGKHRVLCLDTPFVQ